MDISNFMTWFVEQCIRIFTFTYNQLDSIQFGGTSMLRIIIMITILSSLVGVALTIPAGIGRVSSERRPRKENKENDNKSK